MISNKEVALITNLSIKKYRHKHGLFIAEGEKLVKDLINSDFKVYKILTSDIEKYQGISEHTHEVSENKLKKMSNLKNPSSILGVFKIPEEIKPINKGLQLVLDDIQDPGNMGTIIRLCDWYGIKELICSKETVDCYNPKVVQASMGSLARVKISYLDIENHVKQSTLTIVSSLLEGKNIYQEDLPKDAIIIMGNEGNGIRQKIQDLSDLKLTIPQFGIASKVESLNVAMATAIFLSEFKR